jgi:steroid delta-isomerase-like uncharacterized protein
MLATQSSDATAVAAELMDAFSADDWQRFREILQPNVVYEETGTQRRAEGVDEYLRLCQGWKAAFPDAHGTVRRSVENGDTVVQEVVWEGTHRGPLAVPGGTIPPSGQRIRTVGTMWCTVADGRVREIHHHLDVLTLLQQVGALSAPAATGA